MRPRPRPESVRPRPRPRPVSSVLYETYKYISLSYYHKNHKTDITKLLLPVAKMLTDHRPQSKGIAFEKNKFFQQSVGHSGTIPSHYQTAV